MFQNNTVKTNFSGTPTYGHLWKAAIYDIADTLFGPKYIYMFVYNQNLWNMEIFYKADWFSSPTVPELHKIHSIIGTLFYWFHKSVHHIQ